MADTQKKPHPTPAGKLPRGVKGPKIENAGEIMGRLMRYLWRYYGVQLIVVAVCIVVSVLANVQGTMFTQTLIDEYILPMIGTENPDFEPLLQAITKVACFYLVGVAAAFAQSRIMIYVTQGTLKKLRVEIFTHMESLPIKYFDTHPHGDIMSVYTNDIDILRQMISQSMPQFLNSAITIVSVLGSMLIISVPLTLVSLLMVFFMMNVTKFVAGKSGKYFMLQQQALGAANGYIEEMMEGQKVVKVFCREEENVKKFKELNGQLYESAKNANTYANLIGPVNAQLGNVSYVVCAIVGGAFSVFGISNLTLGGLASFLTFNKSFNHPINQISQQMNSIVMAMAGADRIFKLLDEKPEVDDGYVKLVNATKIDGNLVETDKHPQSNYPPSNVLQSGS